MDRIKELFSSKKSHRIILVTGALLLAVIGAAVTYMVLAQSKKPEPVPQTTDVPIIQSQPTKDPKIGLTRLATGLSGVTGIGSTRQPNDTRLFVLEQSGKVQIIQQNGKLSPMPFLDISRLVNFKGEMGLLGIVFSPNYATDHYFFVNYIDKNQNSVIARFTTSSDKDRADMTTKKVVLSLPQPYENHKGGDLAFGSDGYLYAAFGDGGSAGDPQNRSQNLNNFFGKILRLDVRELPYAAPSTNPYKNQTGAKPEVWASGLRNPWRISFDRETQDLYIADVGQNKTEELNVQSGTSAGGENYGWRCYEGLESYNVKDCKAKEAYTFPVLTYDHSESRCSITGGYVYRGIKFPELKGKYFYGDYCSGDIYWTQKSSQAWTQHLALKTKYSITAFGEDSMGEMYVANGKTGSIYSLKQLATE